MANWKLKVKHKNTEAGAVPIHLSYTKDNGTIVEKNIYVGEIETVYDINDFAENGVVDVSKISYGRTVQMNDRIVNVNSMNFGGGVEAEITDGAEYTDGDTTVEENNFIPTRAQVDEVFYAFKNDAPHAYQTVFNNTPEWAQYSMREDILEAERKYDRDPSAKGEEVVAAIVCGSVTNLGAVYLRNVLLGATIPYFALKNYSREGSGIFLEAYNAEGVSNGWHMYGNQIVNGRLCGQGLTAFKREDTIIDLSNGATNSTVITFCFIYDYSPMALHATQPKGKFYIDGSETPVVNEDRTFVRVKLKNGPHKVLGVPASAGGITPVTFGVHLFNAPHYSCNIVYIVAIRGGAKSQTHLYNQALERNFMQPNSLFEMAVNEPERFQALKDSLKESND